MPTQLPPPITPVSAITFDVGGTLLKPHPSVGEIYSEILARHGIAADPRQLNRNFERALATIRHSGNGTTDESRETEKWRGIVRRTFAEINIDSIFDQIFSELWETFTHRKRWQLREETRETIAAIRSKGIRTAVLSNWDRRLRPLLAEFDLSPAFEAFFISSEIGWEKPAPQIFQAVSRQLELPPEKILHVGDSPENDAAPAINAGWQAVLLSDSTPAPQNGYPRIESLGALLAVPLAN